MKDMPMPGSVTPMDVVVFVALAFALALTLAWSISPRLRAFIERPKHQFQDAVRSYDRSLNQDRDS